MRRVIKVLMISLFICLLVDAVFANAAVEGGVCEHFSVIHMKNKLDSLCRDGQISEREKQESLRLLDENWNVLINFQEVEKAAQRIPIDINHASARKTIEKLSSACSVYFRTHQKYPERISEFSAALKLHKQRKDGYIFSYVRTEDGFNIQALPIIPKVSGINNYYVDQTNNVRFTIDGSMPTDTSGSFAFTPFYEKHDAVAYFKQIGKENKYRIIINKVRDKVKNKQERRHKITIVGHKKRILKIMRNYKKFIEKEMSGYGITILDDDSKSSFEIEDYDIKYKYDQTGMQGYIKIKAIVDVEDDIVVKINILEKKI